MYNKIQIFSAKISVFEITGFGVMNRRKLIWFSLLALKAIFVLLFFLRASRSNDTTITSISRNYESPDFPYPLDLQKEISKRGIVQAREYSFKLNKKSLQPRTLKLNEVVSIIKEVGNFHNMNEPKISVRYEEGFPKISQICNFTTITARTMRTRTYLSGHDEGITTLDIKANFIPVKKSDFRQEWTKLFSQPLEVSKAFRSKKVIDKFEEG